MSNNLGAVKKNPARFAQVIYSRGQRAKWACLHAHLAAAARVKYPAALQRCKFDAPLLAEGLLTQVADR